MFIHNYSNRLASLTSQGRNPLEQKKIGCILANLEDLSNNLLKVLHFSFETNKMQKGRVILKALSALFEWIEQR